MSDEAEQRKQAIAGVFDRGAERYDTIGDFFTPIARHLVALAGVRPGEHVLDMGCGRGAATFAAAETVGSTGRVVAIDLAPRMVELTSDEAQRRGFGHVAVELGDADDPAYSAGSFDVLLGAFVLFFLPDAVAAMRRYRRLLRGGGRLAFTTFARSDPAVEAAMEAVGGYVPGGLPPRNSRQGVLGSPDGIRQAVEAAGYRSPRVEEREFETRFADPDEWLAWTWSNGGRASLERVPADLRAEAEAAAKAAILAAQTPRGDLAVRTAVRFTVAEPT